jgi:hypothetical protein
MPYPPIIERAFEIARAGGVKSIAELRVVLRRERYDSVEHNTSGMAIQKQLRALIEDAHR